MNLVVSIAPRSMREALAKLRELRRSPELVELRIDGIRDLDPDLDMKRLLRRPRARIIITNRRRDQGGKFGGSAEKQVHTLSRALRLGAEYADIELQWGMRQIQRLRRAAPGGRLIVSHHVSGRPPASLRPILRRLRATPGHILKLVIAANDITDNKKIFDLLVQSLPFRRRIAAFCMNEPGQISRILGGKFGSALTYAAPAGEKPTASGQLFAPDLKTIYRVDALNRHTRIFGLAGNPVSQSKGYLYHNQVFRRKSLNAVYVNFLIENLEAFLDTFRGDISGLSITMPFKQQIVSLLDHVNEDARILQSVNTVVARKGTLEGFNTDFAAVRTILRRRTSLRGKRAIVLGSGATAATFACAARLAGARTTIVGRSGRKARALASLLDCEWAPMTDLRSLTGDILFNATPVGMAPEPSASIVPSGILRRGMIVFDAVYNPPSTLLLREARARGCTIIPGTELFREQARLQSGLFLEQFK